MVGDFWRNIFADTIPNLLGDLSVVSFRLKFYVCDDAYGKRTEYDRLGEVFADVAVGEKELFNLADVDIFGISCRFDQNLVVTIN